MLWPFKVIATRLGTRCRVLLADLRGAGSEGHDDDAEPYDGAEVRQPLGLFARPRVTATLVAWAIRMGDQVKPLFLTDKSQAPFTDLDEGETDLYNDVTRIRLRSSGNVEIGAGATKGAIRDGDSVVRTVAMQTWMTDVEAKLSLAGHPVTTPFAGTQIGVADGGSATVKVKD